VSPPREPMALDTLTARFRQYLHLPDRGPLVVVLAVAIANLMAGDPTWLLVIGGPSSGKSEMLNALRGRPGTHEMSTATVAGFLSGSSVKEGDDRATGGVLSQIAKSPNRYGLVLVKDLTTLLSGAAETRDAVFGFMREVFDGSVTRALGTEGGRVFKWAGKVGVIAAVTGAIDLVDMGLLGDRYLYLRYPVPSPEDARAIGERVLANSGREKEMRGSLADAAGAFIDGLGIDPAAPPPALDGADQDRLIDLATLAVRCRSAVVFRGADLELLPASEEAPRLLGELNRVAGAMTAMGVEAGEMWHLLGELATGGVHRDRFAALVFLAGSFSPSTFRTTATVAGNIRRPMAPTLRHLQALQALGLVESEGSEHDTSERWCASDWTISLWPSFSGVPVREGHPVSAEVVKTEAEAVTNVGAAFALDPFDVEETS